MSDDGTIILRTFQHRGEEPTHWVQLEDVAELVKAAQALATDAASWVDRGALPYKPDTLTTLEEALKPFEKQS